ncbi:MAG: alanine racemase [Desulfobacterales bacterium]
MSSVRLFVEPAALTRNASRTVELARRAGCTVAGVTKGVAGHPEVARALLAGGIEMLADSRLEHLERLRAAGIRAPLLLIRSSAPAAAARTVELADASLQSVVEVVEALSIEARLRGRTHGVILMVDLHTGREGLPAERVPAAARRVASLPGIRFLGLGAYFSMTSSPELRREGLEALCRLARRIENETGRPLAVVSGGSSNIFHALAVDGQPNPGVNHLRIGTAILLGFSSSLEPVTLPGFERDTFRLEAEVIEVKTGSPPEAILALGTIEVEPRFLFPLQSGVAVREASSDHLLVRLPGPARAGDRLSFRLGYPALSRLAASPYVSWEFARPA